MFMLRSKLSIKILFLILFFYLLIFGNQLTLSIQYLVKASHDILIILRGQFIQET